MAVHDQNVAFIESSRKSGVSGASIARRLFCYDHPVVFGEKRDAAFQIFDTVARHFKIPIWNVRAVGSGQVGYSIVKQLPFVAKQSDFDLAIIDPHLFSEYSALVYRMTDGYSVRTSFPKKNGVDTSKQFMTNLAYGFFRPDLMPVSPERESWFRFFKTLSGGHNDLFSDINCGLYLSELIFEQMQASSIEQYYPTRL